MDLPEDQGTLRRGRDKSLAPMARSVPLLRLLPGEALSMLFESSRVVNYPKRRNLLTRGEKSDWLGIVLSGSVQVLYVSDEGREIGLNVLKTGEFFGELAVIDGEPRAADVVALTAVRILRVPGKAARELIYQYPTVSEHLLRHCTRKIREMTELRAVQCLPHTQSRLRALLRMLSVEQGNQRVIQNLPSQQQLAFMINTSRENLCRSLADLKKRGLVTAQGRTLVVKENPLLDARSRTPLGSTDEEMD